MSWIRDIEKAYGIDILRIRAVKDVYQIHTRRHGLQCLKPYDFCDEDVEFIARVQQHLVDTGFSFGPKTLLTRDNRMFTHANGHRYMITNWVQGQSPSFRFAAQLKESVRQLARFHKHAKHLSVPTIPQRRLKVWHLEDRLKRTRQIIKNMYQGLLSKEFAELCEESLLQVTTSSVRQAVGREFERKAFVHGDYNYSNLVMDTKGRHHIIDFDNTSLNVRMEDLAHVIHRNYPWDVDATLRLIECYDCVRSIGQDDLLLLRALLYEPYPIMRAIGQRGLHTRQFKSMLPSRATLNHYSKRLHQLIL